MSERTWVSNGRFLHDLANWTASGATYSPGDGDEHYGVAVLTTGQYIEQTFSVPATRVYTLALSVKGIGAAITAGQVTAAILDSDGTTVVSKQPTGTADTWTENTFTIGLAPGMSYTLRITNVSHANVRIDDVWLWYVPVTRATLASRVHAKLARLATNRELSPVAAGTLTEGDYTYAVESGLRAAGAINPETGEIDIRYLDESTYQTALDLVEREMLEFLQRDYAVEVDVQIGPRREQLSQVARGIEAVLGVARDKGVGGGSGQVVTRKLRRESEDYEF